MKTRGWFALCYFCAAVLWLFGCAVRSGVFLYNKAGGTLLEGTLTAEQLTFEGFLNYHDSEWITAPDEDPNWYLSTDNDPKMFWTGTGYLETVELHARHKLPCGSVVLYYLLPGQTDYSERQKLYASVVEPGVYRFELGGKTVAGLRVDPDSEGGVPTLFTGVVLNPTRPWYMRFVPDGGQWAALLGLPAVAAALLSLGAELLPRKRKME